MEETNVKDVAYSHNSKNNKKLFRSLPGLKAVTYIASSAGIVLVLGSFCGVYALVHMNNQSRNSPVADLTLVNSASPSISPLIYGTNLAMDSSGDQFLSNAGAAPALQGLHAQLIRMPIRDQLTAADYTTALNKIKQIGATPLLIVHGAAYNGGADPYPTSSALLQIAKNIFPTQTVYVDVGNEEDLANVNVQSYTSSHYGWNAEVPKYKQLTGSNFKYGGPVNYQYDRSYIDTFIATANPAPDYIVWHAYAGSCGHNTGTGNPDSQANLLASVDKWGTYIKEISNDFAIQNGGAHKGTPIIIDEWNYASDLGVGGSASPCYSNDQTFINAFFNKAFNTFIAGGQYGVIGTAEYEAFLGGDENLLTSSNTPTFQGQVFKASYEANIGKTPPPPPSPSYSCSSLSATVDPANAMAYSFTATAQVANGAVLNDADFNFGDGATTNTVAPSGLTITVSHTYGATGTFNAVATLHFTASNNPVTATCTKQVVVSSGSGTPTYSGTLSATPDSQNSMLYQFVGRTATSGGATFLGADIVFGDGKTATGLTPSAGGSLVQTNHTYTAVGAYTAKATFRFLVSGATKTTTASTQVVVTGPGGTGGGGGNQKVVTEDTFSRPNQNGWGISSDGQRWGADASGDGSLFTIKNKVGLISNTGNSSTGTLSPMLTNSQVVFTGRINRFNYSNFGAVLRYKDANNWYKAYLDGNVLFVQKRVNSNYTTLKTVSFKASANTNYTVRFQAVGNTLSAKAWAASSSEPAGWDVTVTDNSFSSGVDGLRALPQEGNVVGYYYFKVYQL